MVRDYLLIFGYKIPDWLIPFLVLVMITVIKWREFLRQRRIDRWKREQALRRQWKPRRARRNV